MNTNLIECTWQYYDPSYFESELRPDEPFLAQLQFMPPYRPPVYNAALQPFRDGGFRGNLHNVKVIFKKKVVRHNEQ